MNFSAYPTLAILLTAFAVETLNAAPPVLVKQPEALTVAAGSYAGFVVEASGTAPLSYEWYKDGTVLPGETRDVLYLPNVPANAGGDYSVKVSNAEGSVTSGPAKLTISPWSSNWRDASYTPDSRIKRVVGAAMLRDGRLVVACEAPSGANSKLGGIYILGPNGSIQAQLAGSGELWMPNRSLAVPLLVQSNGRILASVSSQDGDAAHLIAWESNGVRATSFNSTAAVSDNVALQGDKIIVLGEAGVRRLNADGTPDPSFSSDPTETGAFVDARGRIYVYGTDNTLIRLLQDGTRDPNFHPPSGWLPSSLALLDDGRLVITGGGSRPIGIRTVNVGFYCLRDDGTVDPNFSRLEFPISSYVANAFQLSFTPVTGGRFLVASAFGYLGDYRRNGLALINSDGSVDPEFCPLDLPEVGSSILKRWTFVGADSSVYYVTIQGVVRLKKPAARAPLPPRILKVESDMAVLSAGSNWPLRIYAVGDGPLSVDNSIGRLVGDRFPDVLFWNMDQPLPAWSINLRPSARVLGPAGRSAEVPLPPVQLVESAPWFYGEPEGVVANPGEIVTFYAEPRGTPMLTCQWLKDGVPISGETTPTLQLAGVREADQGAYSLQATNPLGTTVSRPARLRLAPHGWLANISIRALPGEGSRTLAMGFVLRGAGKKQILMTALGGAELAAQGIARPMPDPALDFYQEGVLQDSSDDGVKGLPASDPADLTISPYFLAGAPALSPGSKSAHYVATREAGAYTVQVSGAGRQPGIVLSEIFDADRTSSRIINLSARAWVGTGEAVAICGLVVRGDVPLRVLMRAVGPGLFPMGVTDTLSDPVMRVVAMDGTTLATNDDWDEPQNGAGPVDLDTVKGGAFPLAPGSRDAATALTLQPGNYTFLVSGKDGTTGVCLLETYVVPSE